MKANVVYVKRKGASETPRTKQLWIYDLCTNKHFTLKTNPLKRAIATNDRPPGARSLRLSQS